MENIFNENYKFMLEEYTHEVDVFEYLKERANEGGYSKFRRFKMYGYGDKIIFEFRNKLIALVELGKDLSEGANLIVSHIDSPRLDVLVGNAIVEKDDGVFVKVAPYGGIIPQLWFDRPLVLVGRAYNDEGEVIKINTKDDNIFFTLTSLLPHLNGRKEIKEMTYDKLMVRVGNNKKENVLEFLKEKYNLTEENLELAELSFVPYFKALELGFDKDLLSAYGHDDRVCAYAEIEGLLYSNKTDRTKIALFTSYEETGSNQSSGAISEFIDDIFLMLTKGNILLARECMRNTLVISADVCAGFDSNFANHFEDSAKAICGNGVGIVAHTGNKRGNDSTLEMREHIKKLCKKNDIKYQLETTKVSEGGGGTVAMYFATRGMEVIDVGVSVLAMHSPQEVISLSDLHETYKLYKVFFEYDD